MRDEPIRLNRGLAGGWRAACCLFVVIVLFSLTAALGAEPPQGDKAAAGQVEVRLTDYAIDMPKTLPAGPTTFLVRNEGRNSHSLKIVGPGVEELLSAPVPPHGTGTLKVTLQAGDYTVYCPVGRHASKGMTVKLVVTVK